MIKSAFSTESTTEFLYKVERKPFQLEVITTGELKAENSEDISGPFGFRDFGITRIEISDLIPEGIVVHQGDYVAMLDRSPLS